MSLRACCYKDCENYSINGGGDELTLFQFPKDPNRRKIWMELGQVDARIPSHELYMCSVHFDRNKYMSVNRRRTILLGTAEPFPYIAKPIKSLEEGTVSTKDADSQCTEQSAAYIFLEDDDVEVGTSMNAQKIGCDTQYQIESTIENEHLFTYSEVAKCSADNSEDIDVLSKVYKVSQSPQVTLNRKRRNVEIATQAKQISNKNPDDMISISLPTKQRSQPETRISVPDGNNAVELDLDENTLIDPNFVSTFIYRNEEYVQMSREYFLKDKIALLQTIKRYEDVIRSIKHRLNVLDLS